MHSCTTGRLANYALYRGMSSAAFSRSIACNSAVLNRPTSGRPGAGSTRIWLNGYDARQFADAIPGMPPPRPAPRRA